MYIINLEYKKEISEVEKKLEEHIKFLDEYYNKGIFICSGKKVPRTGGIIIAKINCKEDLEIIIKKDPFYINGIADYKIIEFVPSKYKEGFEKFL